MSTTLILLLLLGSTYAATHVNISIAQQPAGVTYVDGPAPAELRAGPADFSYRNEEQSARLIQPDSQGQKENTQTSRVQVLSNGSSSSGSSGGGSSSSSNGGGNSGNSAAQQVSTQSQPGLAPPLPPRKVAPQMRRRGHFRRVSMQQRVPHSGQFRQRSQQNQEFERYVQTYSGPTVETVFESSSPAPQLQEQSVASSSSSAAPQRQLNIGSRPKQMHTFERQVALPVAAQQQQSANVEQQQQQDTKPIYEAPQSAPVAKAAVASNNVNNAGPKGVASSEGKALFDSNQSGVGAGYDLSTFDSGTSYNRPSYDQSNYNYDDSQDLQDQYPPSVDAAEGYSDYDDQTQYINKQPPSNGYLPQRPVVTKTIQIVQPALKAKKYEVRHPAIQKEFYDIEERVVIKPAGTLVVELDHPVAKIPRGETVLALGHPHPAVASAYNTNTGVTQSQTSSGVYNNQNRNQQQYSSNNLYAPTKQAVEVPVLGSTTVGSSVTTMPAYDQAPKDGFVEAKLRQPYNSGGNDAQFVTTTERSEKQSAGNDMLLVADRNGNQLQINSKNLSPKQVAREEDELRYEPNVDVRSNGAPLTSNFERSQDANFNYNPNNQYQGNFNGNNQFNEEYFTGEYIDSNANNVNHQDSKPARLQQAETPATTSQAHVIRHEHNINLPPSQHNIYLSRSVQVPKEQRIADDIDIPAQVSEIRPYLQRQPGSRVVYAKAMVRPAPSKVRSGAYNNQRAEPSYFRQPESARYREPETESIEYSAPYSRMRYNPDQTARLIQESRPEKPVIVDEPVQEQKSQQVPPGHTHIQIQVPHHSDGEKPIVVSSTISPPVSAARTANYRQPAHAYASNPNREVETFNEQRGDQSYGQLQSKPDCDQVDGVQYSRQIRPVGARRQQQHFQRLVEAPAATQATSSSSSSSSSSNSVGGGSSNSNSKANANLPNVQTDNVDVLLKSTAGHITTGQRVIAATAAPTDAASSRETFHKRRIVVNHPFQTVREVVEHEPITNYHQIQVSEPASPALYHQAAYYQPPEGTHGNLVYHQSSATHGNLFEPAALQYR